MLTTGAEYDVVSLGYHTPFEHEVEELKEGEVGFITASIKSLSSVSVGDTITDANDPTDKALPGYKPMKPMVYCGIYPIESNKYPALKEAIEKLKLNDAALEYEPETSGALGSGFRCGFLGLLHLEIIEERLDREFDLSLITTSPSVIYKVHKTNGEVLELNGKVISDNELLIQKDFDNELYDKLKRDNTICILVDTSVKYIDRRLRSINELRDYLKNKEEDTIIIEEVIDKLISRQEREAGHNIVM